MQCQVTVDGNQMRIALVGQLIYSDTAAFADVLQQAKTERPQTCLVDLGGLEYIDSSGLRMLLLIYGLCRDQGAQLTFAGAAGQVQEMLLHCRFETIVSIGE